MSRYLEIIYENSKVEKYFNDYSLMQKKIGLELTRSVKKHMNNIEASNTFSTFLALGLGKPHSLETPLSGCYGVSVSGNVRLIIKPQSEDLSAESLRKCDTIVVMGVEDYHGKKNEWIIP